MQSWMLIAGIVVVGLILLISFFYKAWQIAEPNEALIISGIGKKNAADTEDGFEVITGKGKIVTPGIQRVRRLSLDLHSADLYVECVTQQGVPVTVKGTVIYKIGDDITSITNAARRFLDQQDQMDTRVHNVFAGHLRSIIGSLTVEQMIREREALTAKTRESSASEMVKLGLIIDSLQIQEIDDPSGYILNLAKPHIAAVQSQARIAEAAANQEAVAAEQVANANNAQAERDSQVRQSALQAEMNEAAQKADQAGPLAQATARQQVIEQETEAARLEALHQEQVLEATVVRPARAQRDADIANAEGSKAVAIANAEAQARSRELAAGATATAQKLEGEAAAKVVELTGAAEAAAILARGQAEGEAIKAKGLAEAAGIQAKADALENNQEAVLAQINAENLPKIVAAAASAFDHVDNFTVLNGTEGVNNAMMQVIGTGLASAGAIAKAFKQNLTQDEPTMVPAPKTAVTARVPRENAAG